MVWLIIGIFLVIMIGLAALVRSLRLDKPLKAIFSIFSLLSIALAVVALIGTLNPTLGNSFVRVFLYSGMAIAILTLILAVHFLRVKHNRVFTDKAKEHHESVARILAKEKEQNKD